MSWRDVWSDAVSQRHNSIVEAPVPFLWQYTPLLPEETSHWSVGRHSRWRQFYIQPNPVGVGDASGGSLAPALPAVRRDLLLVLSHTRLADVCGGVNTLKQKGEDTFLPLLNPCFSCQLSLLHRATTTWVETWSPWNVSTAGVLFVKLFPQTVQHFTSSSFPSVPLSSATHTGVWIVILRSNTSSNLCKIKIYWPIPANDLTLLLCLAPAPSIDRSTKPSLDRLAPPYERESPGSGQYLLTLISLGLL